MSKPDQQAISIVESLCSANSHSNSTEIVGDQSCSGLENGAESVGKAPNH